MSTAGIEVAEQYLTFKLGEELFALEIGTVREVLDFAEVTRVPRMPEFMRGVINLRGNVIPVADLRIKFGIAVTERTVNTCIIITEVTVDGEKITLGCLADLVQGVIDLTPEDISAAPKIGTRLDTAFIRGMGKRDSRFIMILDIDNVFTAEDLGAVKGSQTLLQN